MNSEKQVEQIFENLRKNSRSPLSKFLYDFSRGEVGTLGFLAFEHDGVTAGELSENINVTTPRIAKILNSLENKQYIKRKEDSNDKRKVLVYITDIGRDLAQKTKEDIMKKIAIILKELSYEEVKEYMRINEKIKEILEKQ